MVMATAHQIAAAAERGFVQVSLECDSTDPCGREILDSFRLGRRRHGLRCGALSEPLPPGHTGRIFPKSALNLPHLARYRLMVEEGVLSGGR